MHFYLMTCLNILPYSSEGFEVFRLAGKLRNKEKLCNAFLLCLFRLMVLPPKIIGIEPTYKHLNKNLNMQIPQSAFG